MPYVPILGQNGQLLMFRPKFGDIAQLREYFGSNIVEGVAESWMEVSGAGWRWIELGGAGCTV